MITAAPALQKMHPKVPAPFSETQACCLLNVVPLWNCDVADTLQGKFTLSLLYLRQEVVRRWLVAFEFVVCVVQCYNRPPDSLFCFNPQRVHSVLCSTSNCFHIEWAPPYLMLSLGAMLPVVWPSATVSLHSLSRSECTSLSVDTMYFVVRFWFLSFCCTCNVYVSRAMSRFLVHCH